MIPEVRAKIEHIQLNNHAHVLRGTELCETKWFYYAYQHKSLFDAITRQGAGRYKLTKEGLLSTGHERTNRHCRGPFCR